MTAIDVGSRSFRRATELAAPRALPLLGHLPAIRRDPLRFFTEAARQYGDIVPIRLGLDRVLMVNNPDYVGHILQANFRNYRKSDYYQRVRPIFGDSLLMQEGEAWLKLRRTAQPAFQGPRIRAMSAGVLEVTDAFLARWRGRDGEGHVCELNQEMMRLALDIVFRILLQVSLGDRFEQVFRALGTVLREAERRVWTLTDMTHRLPSRRKREFHKALALLDGVVAEIVEARRHAAVEHDDLLSLLMAAYDDPASPQASARQLRDEVLTFLIGGHETTAAGLAWTLHLLSTHPEVMQLLRDEVDTVLGGRAPTYSDLANLPYTAAVFLETLRLYPPVWTLSRTALGDDVLGTHEVPAGSTVMLCAFAMHRNPRYWPEPDRFAPERFLPENAKDRPAYTYFPFSGGPRACIGGRLAQIEATLILARIAQGFQVTTLPDQVIAPEPTITLRPRYGIHAQIVGRRT